MQKTRIIIRRLSDKEIDSLINEIKLFPHLTYVSRNNFQKAKTIYVLEIDNKLAGICVVYPERNWVKLGPLVFLNAYQGRGLATNLILEILKSNSDKNIIVVSSNPKVKNILNKFGFIKARSFISLEREVKILLLKQLLEYSGLRIYLEAIRKRIFMKRGSINFYFKYTK